MPILLIDRMKKLTDLIKTTGLNPGLHTGSAITIINKAGINSFYCLITFIDIGFL